MKVVRKAMWIGISVIFAVGITACEKPGPAETTGKSIDEATEKAGQSLDNAAKKINEQGEKVGEVISDAAMTAKVKAAILAEPTLSSLQISVNTTNEEVTLSGAVDSQQNIDKAKEIASAVDGVKRVENQLLVKSTK